MTWTAARIATLTGVFSRHRRSRTVQGKRSGASTPLSFAVTPETMTVSPSTTCERVNKEKAVIASTQPSVV
jgi:hypothetical protein